jgi:small subunit ribosomal protein S18
VAERSNDRSKSSSGYKPRYAPKPRFCKFCSDREAVIDYKDVKLMKQFTNEEGKIRSRRQTGTCAKHQRAVARAVKRARHIALLSFTGETWD